MGGGSTGASDRFDAAEFAVAKDLALEVLTISRVLAGGTPRLVK